MLGVADAARMFGVRVLRCPTGCGFVIPATRFGVGRLEWHVETEHGGAGNVEG